MDYKLRLHFKIIKMMKLLYNIELSWVVTCISTQPPFALNNDDSDEIYN